MGKHILMGISRNQGREDLRVAEQCMRKCIFSQIDRRVGERSVGLSKMYG